MFWDASDRQIERSNDNASHVPGGDDNTAANILPSAIYDGSAFRRMSVRSSVLVPGGTNKNERELFN